MEQEVGQPPFFYKRNTCHLPDISFLDGEVLGVDNLWGNVSERNLCFVVAHFVNKRLSLELLSSWKDSHVRRYSHRRILTNS